MSDTVTFDGQALGDGVVRAWVEVQRAIQPSVLSGVHRTTALVSDVSPNIFYVVNVVVHKRASSMYDAMRWTLEIGDMMTCGPKELVLTLGSNVLVTKNACLVGPVSPPQADQQNPAIIDRLQLVFESAERPR